MIRLTRTAVILMMIGLLSIFLPQLANAQNQYPASGDALIHGLTIGTGAGPGSVYNTALGANALYYNGNGYSNVAVGNGALNLNTSGSANTALGTSALYRNLTGYGNTAGGYASLLWNSAGNYNSAVGTLSLQNNTSGNENTAFGYSALSNNTTGNTNAALGFFALGGNQTGYSNIAIGVAALSGNSGTSNLVAVGDSSMYFTTGLWNTAVGSKTLYTNTTGEQNTALGFQVLYTNSTGFNNTAMGYKSLFSSQNGYYNNAFGSEALYSNTTGGDNIALGNFSLWTNSSGYYNTATGMWALYDNSTGMFNCAFGVNTLQNNTTGNYNTSFGSYATVATGALSNATSLGYDAVARNNNSVAIGNSSVTSIGGYANWTNFSDGRYKKNIQKNVPGLAFINKLEPITYTLDINGIETKLQTGRKRPKSPDGTEAPDPMSNSPMQQAMKEKSQVLYTGFVAQDVDKAAKSLGYDFSGVDRPADDQQSFYGLRYSDFVVPLVKAVQELSAQNDSLKAANTDLNNRLTQIEAILGIKPDSATNNVVALSSARLFQNSPNPFGQSTLINYYLPQNIGTAVLQITDLSGQVIRSLVLSGTGRGQITLQTSQLAAGVYTYSLLVDGALIDTKKMVLMK